MLVFGVALGLLTTLIGIGQIADGARIGLVWIAMGLLVMAITLSWVFWYSIVR